MKMYEYMVVYSCPTSTGRCSITTDKLIDSYARVKEVDITIREQCQLNNAFVIDFKLLREIDC